ncbi:MAG TPA: class I SAM-dependent methyltransferase [Pseudonocardiaceae bacterium]|nr:class I SAM-dependent methyltransferase [Pseudonocardiaceae bacterium]
MAEPTLPSPNIWYWPGIYEIENRAQDVHGAIWAALREEIDWAGRDVLDVGCGDGFHLPVFAAAARSVVGVEPYQPLVRRARDRVAELANVAVLAGGAGRLPVPAASVDLVHARTAYFFGRGCEPGMAEADRVLRSGGALAIVDLDVSRAPYGDWMRADLPDYDPADVEAFFAEYGFRCRKVLTEWRFPDAASLVSVLRIEFSERVAEWAIAEVTGLSIPVGYRIHVREKPTGLLLPR